MLSGSGELRKAGAGKNETIQGSGLECMWEVMVTTFQERSGVLWLWVGNASLLDGGIEIIHSFIYSTKTELSPYPLPRPWLDSEDTASSQTDFSAFME